MLDQSGVLGGAELSLLEIMKHMRANADVLLFDDGPFRAALDEIGARVDVVDRARSRACASRAAYRPAR